MVINQNTIKRENNRLLFFDYKDLLFDEYGNLKKAYEIVRYEKYSDGKWYEEKKYNTYSGSIYVVNDKIYHLVNDKLLPINMNPESETCGVYEQIIRELLVTHKITNNEVLLKFKYFDEVYSVCKQSYSDITPFYTLQDSEGQFELNHASHSLLKLVETAIECFRDEKIRQQLLSIV